MNSSNKVYIRTILGQKVDIRDYQKLYEEGAYDDVIPEQVSGMFLEFYWHDLTSGHNFMEHPWSKLLDNEGIREDQDLNRNYLDFSHSIDVKGWLIKFYPPIFDTIGTPRNGRKRIRKFVGDSERWIPAARWTYEIPEEVGNPKDDYELNRIDTGLQANAPTDNSEPVNFGAYKEGGRKKVQIWNENGKKFNTPSNIDKWFKQQGVFNLFHVDTVKKLRDAIMNMDQRGQDFMVMMKQPEAEKWLLQTDFFISRKINSLRNQPIDSKEKIVLYSPSDVNLFRVFAKHILPNSAKGIKTLIILYVLGSNPKQNIKDIKEFRPKVHELTNNCVEFIQHDLSGVKLDIPFISSMYEFVGAIPQISRGDGSERHNPYYERFELISIENY